MARAEASYSVALSLETGGERNKMTNEKITCPECNGEIGIPSEFTRKLKCPRCDEVVYSRDADTGVTWSATRQASPVPPPSPAPSPDNVIPPILAQTPEVEQKDQRPYVVPICLTLGALGVFSSVVVTANNSGSFPELLINAVLNPLIWAGFAGLVLLYKPRKTSGRYGTVDSPSPNLPLPKNQTSQRSNAISITVVGLYLLVAFFCPWWCREFFM